jgi:hypothetical protein
LPDSSRWLTANGIGYVLWGRDDNQLPPLTFEKLNGLVQDRYAWHGYYEIGVYHVGL